jgi:hypothetical protein
VKPLVNALLVPSQGECRPTLRLPWSCHTWPTPMEVIKVRILLRAVYDCKTFNPNSKTNSTFRHIES